MKKEISVADLEGIRCAGATKTRTAGTKGGTHEESDGTKISLGSGGEAGTESGFIDPGGPGGSVRPISPIGGL